jgi:hypothetical protein
VIATLFFLLLGAASKDSPSNKHKRNNKVSRHYYFPESKLREYGWLYKPHYRTYLVIIKQRLSRKEIMLYDAPDFITLNRYLYKVLDVDAKFSITPISD